MSCSLVTITVLNILGVNTSNNVGNLYNARGEKSKLVGILEMRGSKATGSVFGWSD